MGHTSASAKSSATIAIYPIIEILKYSNLNKKFVDLSEMNFEIFEISEISIVSRVLEIFLVSKVFSLSSTVLHACMHACTLCWTKVG